LRLYAKLLEPFDAEQAQRAVMTLLYSPREFAPPVGVIVEAINVEKQRATGQFMSAEEAWAEVTEAIRHLGYYRQPTFENEALTRAVAAMDWKEICTNPNVEATRAHFMRIFDMMQQRQMQDSIGLMLSRDQPSKQIENEARSGAV
jgi:hypothetical protein